LIFLTSVPAIFGVRNGNGGMFFFNGGLLPNSWVSRLKIFVSERTSDPSLTCLRGAAPTKSLPGACGVFLRSFIKADTVHAPTDLNSRGTQLQLFAARCEIIIGKESVCSTGMTQLLITIGRNKKTF
jgi:hypothetical protein